MTRRADGKDAARHFPRKRDPSVPWAEELSPRFRGGARYRGLTSLPPFGRGRTRVTLAA